jgi:hemolysin activation/secretion protein
MNHPEPMRPSGTSARFFGVGRGVARSAGPWGIVVRLHAMSLVTVSICLPALASTPDASEPAPSTIGPAPAAGTQPVGISASESSTAGLAPAPVVSPPADATASPTAGTAPAPSEAPTADATEPPPQRFYIRNFRVLGTHGVDPAHPILSNAEIEAVIYPYMGPYRTSQDVEMARAALEKAYQDKGYQTVSVQTPAQSMPDILRRGVVILQVTQFPVGRLRVVGSRYYLPSRIEQQAASMAEGVVPNFNEVTKDVVSLNQLPDRQVTPELRSGELPGTVDINLNVKDTFPLHGSVELNNRYSVDTTSLRVSASIDYDNLWQLGHTLTVSYQVAPENPRQASVYSGSYLARIPGIDWLSLLAYGTKSDSNVNTLGAVNVAGRGKVIGGRMIIALPSEKGFSESVSLGLDYKSYDQGVTLASAPPEDTPVVYLPLSATYSASWQGGDGSLTQLDSGATLSLRGLGSSSQRDFTADRYGSSANFIYLRGDLSRTQPLPRDFELYGKIQAQVADEALVSSEQISAGGLDTVRGYLESEDLGDNGVVGQFEVRTASIGQLNPSAVNDWRLYAFSDAAELGLNDALPQQQTTFNLASVGFGTRIKLFDHFNGSLDAALPLITSQDTSAHTWRLTLRGQTVF